VTKRLFAALIVFTASTATAALAQDRQPAAVPPNGPVATTGDAAGSTSDPSGGSAANPDASAAAPADPAEVPPAVDSAAADAGDYEIGPEDVLDISVWKNPELSRTVPVRPDGRVSLPLVNDIVAAGLTPTELRDQVRSRLSEFIPAPEVSVMVREVHSRKVAVVGSVKMPGRFELKSPMTVLEVIALAQGFTDFASRDRIVVLRQAGDGTTTRLPFNYGRIADRAPQDNFFVEPGDIVVVP
jgi:polysaccharide export outer membrane protein